MINRLFLYSCFLVLAGCASFPESVRLPQDAPTVVYEQVAMDPEKEKGSFAQWGGVVAEVKNLQDKTLLEVVYYPLRAYGRPLLEKESMGRFRVYVNGFLDPMVYQKGRSVTFSGTVMGTEEGLVGEHKYIFPTLNAKGYYLWEDIDRIDVTTLSVWPYPYYGGWYGGFRNWYGSPYYQQRHIIKRRHDHYRYPANTNKSSSTKNSGSASGSSKSNGKSNKDPRPALKKAAKDGKNIP